jgi:hypothetical protein
MAVQLLHQRVADPVQNNHPFTANHAALHDKMAQKGSVWHLSSALSFTLFGKQAFPTPLNTGHCFHSHHPWTINSPQAYAFRVQLSRVRQKNCRCN